jgi:MFS family permease
VRSRARRLVLDTAPLRLDRDYRWMWSGQVISGIGNQITRVALPFQVYVLTGSTLAIAALTLFQLVPILLFALGAGSLADAVDRRRLLMITQTGLAICSLILTGLALGGDPPLPALFAVAFLAAGLGAVDQPTRSSSIPRLVPPERLPAAIALNQLNFQTASIIGPAVGGVLIATVGIAGAYAVDRSARRHALRVPMATAAPGNVTRPGLAAIRKASVRAAGGRSWAFVIDLTRWSSMPTSLFPSSPRRVDGPADSAHGGAPRPGFVGAVLAGSGPSRIGSRSSWLQSGAAITAFGLVTVSFAGLLCLAVGCGRPVSGRPARRSSSSRRRMSSGDG